MAVRRFSTATSSNNRVYGLMSGRVDRTIRATGGTVSQSGGYTYHLFDGPAGNPTAMNPATYTLSVARGGTVDYVIVGGGGSGGTYCSGTSRGGSGGQVLTGTTTLGDTSYSISVGSGGYGWTTVNNGRSTSAFGISASGGTANNRTGTGYTGTYVSNFAQFGDSGYFGGGGGQGVNGYSGYAGGLGGGGQGGSNPTCGVNGCSGTQSTGGGGGGANLNCNASGGGGSGVVIIRYLSSLLEYE